MNKSVLFLLALVVFTCSEKKQESTPTFIQPKIVAAKGYVVPKDSMAEPEIFRIDERKLKKIPAGKPTVVPSNEYVLPANEPKIVIAGLPRVCIPGQDTFSLPQTKKAIHHPILASQPKPIAALPFRMKDDADCNIQYLDAEQGMNSSAIYSILEDKNGNIWFGTGDNGVSKYNGKYFTHFTEKEGLGNNIVWSILEDTKGNLWFGTEGGGVTKYDGKFFTNYTVKEGLSDNFILSILEDKSGNLWFGTAGGGVTKYDGITFTHYTEKQGLGNNIVFSIVEDKKGNLWFGTNNAGVSKFDGKSFSHFTEKEGLTSNFVLSILEDKGGNIWFGTFRGGVSKYDGKFFTHYTEKQGLAYNIVLSIVEDKKGNLWFATEGGGISKFDGKRFKSFTEKQGLNENTVRCLMEDNSGNLWIGTNGGGAQKFDLKSFEYYTERQGLVNKNVHSLTEDKSGNLWFGTKGGISKFDGKSYNNYTEKEGLSNNIVYTILEDKAGNLWFGTEYGGLTKFDGELFTHYTKKDGLIGDAVLTSFQDRSGNLWFSSNGGISKYDGKCFTNYSKLQGLSSNTIYAICEDKRENMWFGTDGGGLNKFDGSSFTHYTEKDGLSNNTVLSMIEDNSGNIWCGTDGGGLSKFDGKHFINYDDRQGLGNNSALSFFEYKRGNANSGMWIGTVKGLSFFDFKTNKITTFHREDGLKSEDLNSNSVLLDSKNRMWWGTSKALISLDMNGFALNQKGPQIELDQIYLHEKFVDYNSIQVDSTEWGKQLKKINFSEVANFHNYPINLELPYDINHLTFQFSAIDWYAPHKIKYRYKLEGLDEDWSGLTAENKADYRSIPFGKYTFKVKAIGSAGKWSKTFEYPFEIHPPWWKTWWFYLLCFLSLFGVAVFIIQTRINKIRKIEQKKNKEELERLELELKVLKSQINPHFMFNALNSIESYIWNNEIKAASEYLGKFARLMRLVLENSHFDTVPIDKELEALNIYLQLEAMRSDFSFEFEVKDETGLDLLENEITPMLLQPFVENAVLHGLNPLKERKGMLQILISKIDDAQILVIIRDNGVGRKKEDKPRISFGMSLTKERILKLNQNNEDALVITDLKDTTGNPMGTEVTIYLPFHSSI